MSEGKEFQFFDNYEEDGQLSLFSADYDDWDEDWVEEPESDEAVLKEESAEIEKKVDAARRVKPSVISAGTGRKAGAETTDSVGAVESSGPDIRVKYCACCGKLLFVREETAGFYSECNNCSVKYFQKL